MKPYIFLNFPPIKIASEMYYHGTSTGVLIDHENPIGEMIIPPSESGVIQEQGRKKNLNKVFFTKNPGSAWIYAGRTKNVLGGEPIVYIVEPFCTADPLITYEIEESSSCLYLRIF